MISRGLKFGDGKTRIAIWLNMTIKLQKAMISLNKHERCKFKKSGAAPYCLYRENRYISVKRNIVSLLVLYTIFPAFALFLQQK